MAPYGPDTPHQHPWRITEARRLVSQIVETRGTLSLTPLEDQMLHDEVAVIAIAEQRPVRQVWLRDVDRHPAWEQAWAAEAVLAETARIVNATTLSTPL